MQYKITAAQKRWQESLRNYGCLVSRSPYCEIHHIVGASAKRQKIWVGQWSVLPLHYRYHRDPECKVNVTEHKRMFEALFGNQWDILVKVINKFQRQGRPIPPEEVILAIHQLAPGGNTLDV